MASSSEELLDRQDWIAALTGHAHRSPTEEKRASPAPSFEPQAGWIAALMKKEGFVEGLPMARAARSEAEASPQPIEASTPSSASASQEPPVRDPIAEARAAGEAEGWAAAMAERDIQDSQRRKLQLTLQALDQAGIDALAADLAATVRALCGQVIADYSPEPERLLDRCQAAARMLGSGLGECALHLHPDDIAQIEPEALKAWRVVEDIEVECGGLRFEGPDGAVSDRPEDWRRAIAAAVGQ